MAVHPCPRCGEMIPVGVAYCNRCRPVAEAQAAEAKAHKAEMRSKLYNRRYNAINRKADDPKYRQFRSSKAWRSLSQAKLADAKYRCEAGLAVCRRVACEVHHIEPIKTDAGWEKRFDWGNLMAVCTSCHNVLDGKNGRRRGRQDDFVVDLRTITG